MSRTTNFSNVTGIAKIDWQITTQTPLCIKSGTTSILNKKTNTLDFDDKAEKSGDENNVSVSDFYFDVKIDEGAPHVVFRIPASSVRGALRTYTIKRLIPKEFRGATLFEAKEGKETDEALMAQKNKLLKDALNLPGWHLIQNLFGLAADTSDEDLENEVVAGRLRISSNHIICRKVMLNKPNAPLSIASRSPLDRVTRGTKDGGFHSFMELRPDHPFSITLHIINPTPEDLGFIAFWENSINKGLIRLGGLKSAGKGRLRVKSEVTLFRRDASQFFAAANDAGSPKDNPAEKDILSNLYPRHQLNWATLKSGYLTKLNTKYEQLGKVK